MWLHFDISSKGMGRTNSFDFFAFLQFLHELDQDKTCHIGVSDQVRHKQGSTVTEDGKRLKILDLGIEPEGLYYL